MALNSYSFVITFRAAGLFIPRGMALSVVLLRERGRVCTSFILLKMPLTFEKSTKTED
jgi:hypothetical protein